MSRIRPLEAADIPAVAALFQKAFRHGRPVPASLGPYLRRYYLEAPGRDPDIAPLVHVTEDGAVTGFIGVHVLPMTFGERRLRAAVCGSLMVEAPDTDPMAGARLLKAFLAGPQDLSLSETANSISVEMWRRLRGLTLPQHSLEWFRIIRPSNFLLDFGLRKSGAFRLLRPLAGLIDNQAQRRLSAASWFARPRQVALKGGLRVDEIAAPALAELVPALTASFALRPDWAAMPLAAMIQEAAAKPDYGEAVMASVSTPAGVPIGAFIYHLQPDRIGRVLQILSRPGQEGVVIDALVDHAAGRGAAGLRGRTQPALIAAMQARRMIFLSAAATVIHAREEGLAAAFNDGRGFFNGLAGEQWSRVIGGRFE